MLERGVGREAVSGDLMGDDFEVFEGCEFRGHAGVVVICLVGWLRRRSRMFESVSDTLFNHCTIGG